MCVGPLLQVRRVQGMINNEPAAALGRQMTRSQALFGEPNQRVLQASAESLVELLGGARCAGQTRLRCSSCWAAVQSGTVYG